MEVMEASINKNHDLRLSPSQEFPFRDLESDSKYLAATNQLIANLGHELQDVRMRALKCLWRKIDCGIISSENISQQTEILNRLTPWIRTTDPLDKNYEGFQLVIRLFFRLAEHEAFRKKFISNHLDTILSKRRLEFGGEIRRAINRLLDKVGSFYIHCEGPADDSWGGNYSAPPNNFTTRVSPKNIALSAIKTMDSDENEIPLQDFFPQITRPYDSSRRNYTVSPPRRNKVYQAVSIKTVRLGPSDRRVLSSTVESLTSKNDNLVFMTCSFVRDVLLNDFPPEVFVQESAVSLSLAQIVQDTRMDDRVNYVAFQALTKLSQLLLARFSQLNLSDFYTHEGNFGSEIKGPQGYYGEIYPLSTSDISASNSDYFAANLCKILRILSRSILFDSNRVTRWVLLHLFTETFLKYVQIFPSVSTKNLMMLLQEILYDLKSSGDTYSNSYSSRPLVPFQPTDDEEVIFGDYLLESISYAYQGRLNDGSWEEPQKAIISFLIDVQNSSGHKSVFNAVHRLREYSFILLLKFQRGSKSPHDSRKGRSGHSVARDSDKEQIFRSRHWREAFYRFLSVEPTSQEDEDLLVRVLDLLTFVLTYLEGSLPLLEWITPLCGTKNCAGFRLLIQHCTKNETDSSGTTLPTILRSLFDFYQCLLIKTANSSHKTPLLWEFFNTLSQVLSNASEEGYSSSASLFGVLYGIAYLTSEPTIQEKLLANRTFIMGLLHRVSETLSAFGERSSGDSFRNRGPIYYSSLSMLHLIIVMNKISIKEKGSNWEWMGKCIENIPFLWASDNLKAKAAGFQICQILCSSTNGAAALLSGLDPPSLAWGMAYRHLTDPNEAPVVQQAAASVILNLLATWDDIRTICGFDDQDFPLEIQEFLDDLVKLVTNVYWHAKLNRCGNPITPRSSKEHSHSDSSDDSASVYSYAASARSAGDVNSTEANEISIFITPNVLSCLCKLFLALVKNNLHSEQARDSTSSLKLPFVEEIMNSGISSLLFRLLSNHEAMVAPDMDEVMWLRCCSALSSIVEVLISISQLDRNSSVILIGDKRSLSHLIQILILKPYPNATDKSKEILQCLWINVFIMLSILCTDAGQNFEDLERNIWSHWTLIFPRIVEWSQNSSPVKCRQAALTFTCSFLTSLTKFQSEKDMKESHLVLCLKTWKEKQCSYGRAWCQSLMDMWNDPLDVEERVTILHGFAALFNLSPDAKKYATENKFSRVLVEKLRMFGLKFCDPNESQYKKNNLDQWHDETLWILSVLTALLYDSPEGRETALESSLADIFHKIFKWWTLSPDRALLHAFIECLLNFTEEFAAGSHSLTTTTSLVGVAPRKVSTPQSLYIELINILQAELASVERNPILKTIDLCFSLLRNSTYATECRTIIAKTSLLSFIRKLHASETKRWGTKQNHVKEEYLKFLVHVTINLDMQVLIAKVPEAVDILLALTTEQAPVSLLAMKVLRNLSFNSGNRPRFLCDASFIPTMALKLRTSSDPEELESAGVALWAIIANSEKGKLLAKQSSCGASVVCAIQRLRQLEKSSNDLSQEKLDFTQLVLTLSNVSLLLGEERLSSNQ